MDIGHYSFFHYIQELLANLKNQINLQEEALVCEGWGQLEGKKISKSVKTMDSLFSTGEIKIVALKKLVAQVIGEMKKVTSQYYIYKESLYISYLPYLILATIIFNAGIR